MADDQILIVDEHDQPIGSATKQAAWTQGLRHRIVRIMVEDDKGRILLQKRASGVQVLPGHWDHSASGHVDADEDYITAARRELAEEIGVSGVELAEIGAYESHTLSEWRKLNRFNKVYRVKLHAPTPLILQADEVSETRWFTLSELHQLVRDPSVKVTNGLKKVITRYY